MEPTKAVQVVWVRTHNAKWVRTPKGQTWVTNLTGVTNPVWVTSRANNLASKVAETLNRIPSQAAPVQIGTWIRIFPDLKIMNLMLIRT